MKFRRAVAVAGSSSSSSSRAEAVTGCSSSRRCVSDAAHCCRSRVERPRFRKAVAAESRL